MMHVARKDQDLKFEVTIDDLREVRGLIRDGRSEDADAWLSAAINRAVHDSFGPLELCETADSCGICRRRRLAMSTAYFHDQTPEQHRRLMADGRETVARRRNNPEFRHLLVAIGPRDTRKALCSPCIDALGERVTRSGEAAAVSCVGCGAVNIRFKPGHEPIIKFGDMKKKQ